MSQKHQYVSWLKSIPLPTIPTVFFDPSDKDIKTTISHLPQTNKIYIKRSVSEASSHVFQFKPSDIKEIQSIMKKHHKLDTFWLIQPSILELEQNPEIKIYIDQGQFCTGFLQFRTKEKGSFVHEELRRDNLITWNKYQIDGAIAFAGIIYKHLLQKCPEVACFFRVDLVLKEKGFLINELEHFGNMWLMTAFSTLGLEFFHRIIQAIIPKLLK